MQPAPHAPQGAPRLWTRDFTLVTFATAFAAAGGIAGEFALSFFVFDQTGSTFAAALVVASQLIPHALVPLAISPVMDRLPRKTFLVAGDVVCGLAYVLLGLWLRRFAFSYASYLVISVALACLQAIDNLAWTSIYPSVIPEGAEQRGYAISSMLFTLISVVMAPVAAVLLDLIGTANILVGEGLLALAAAGIESRVRVADTSRGEPTNEPWLATWVADLRESTSYLGDERGLRSLFGYMAISNGMATGVAPILIAFFRTTPGLSVVKYSFFSLASSIGYALGSGVQYRVQVPKERRFDLAFLIYQFYDLMDCCLLWLPYPLMLVNRFACGCFGANSFIMRNAAMQRYIPERMRSRINAFSDALTTSFGLLMSLVVGWIGDMVDYRICFTVGGLACLVSSWLFVWGRRADVRKVFAA